MNNRNWFTISTVSLLFILISTLVISSYLEANTSFQKLVMSRVDREDITSIGIRTLNKETSQEVVLREKSQIEEVLNVLSTLKMTKTQKSQDIENSYVIHLDIKERRRFNMYITPGEVNLISVFDVDGAKSNINLYEVAEGNVQMLFNIVNKFN